jgi:hypothetical protein
MRRKDVDPEVFDAILSGPMAVSQLGSFYYAWKSYRLQRAENQSQYNATQLRTAIAYLRTSSAANVGTDKDSDKRQRAAIEAFAKRAGYELKESLPCSINRRSSSSAPVRARNLICRLVPL